VKEVKFYLGCSRGVWIYTNQISDVLLGTLVTLRIATISFVMSVFESARPSTWNSLAPGGRIFMKFEISVLFENSQRKFCFLKIHRENSTLIKIWQDLHWRPKYEYIYDDISLMFS
jgi:hypothetical protein